MKLYTWEDTVLSPILQIQKSEFQGVLPGLARTSMRTLQSYSSHGLLTASPRSYPSLQVQAGISLEDCSWIQSRKAWPKTHSPRTLRAATRGHGVQLQTQEAFPSLQEIKL